MSAGARVWVEDVSKRYDGVEALRSVSLEALPGEVTVIAGPSGSGKSTLLRIIAGLEEPDEGRILLDGVDVTREPPWTRRAVMLSQRPVLLPHLTILENIVLAAESQGLGRGEAVEEARRIASYLGIEGVLDRKPGTLSGGQLQRASLAAVISARPRVLLLDEPFAHLDLPLRESFRRLVRRIAGERGATIIQVTHDQDEALEVADKLLVLVNGRVLDSGDPLRVYHEPADLGVAWFLGHNIVCSPPLARDGGPVSFPPEAVIVGEGPYTGRVAYSAPRKHYTLVALESGGSTVRAVIRGVHRWRVGEEVRFAVDEDMVRVWGVEGGCEEASTGLEG